MATNFSFDTTFVVTVADCINLPEESIFRDLCYRVDDGYVMDFTEICDYDPEDEVSLKAYGPFGNAQEEFFDGFKEDMPACYDFSGDCETSNPWCAPWVTYGMDDSKDGWFDPEESWFEMGRKWAAQCHDEYSTIMKDSGEEIDEEDE